MATAARKVSAVVNPDYTTPGLGSASGFKVTFANAAAGDITQLGTDKVLVVIDADGVDGYDKTLILGALRACVAALEKQLLATDRISGLGTSSVVSYEQRGRVC